MSNLHRFLSARFPTAKYPLACLVAACCLTLTGCTGDSLDNVTTNPDGSIKISDTDAETIKSELGATSIPTMYMIELKWDPPTTNASGSPLTADSIKEYQISYYKDGEDPSSSISLSIEKSINRLGIPLTEKGTYHFKITTVDTDGRESDPKLVTASL